LRIAYLRITRKSHHSRMKATSLFTGTVWDNSTRGGDTIREQCIRVAWCDEVVFGVLHLGQATKLPPLRHREVM
jgi:hypothetical protein